MAEIAQMREPQARQRVSLSCVCRSDPSEIAVGERQDHDIARRLAEIERLDQIVKAR
jgi:hypothetical protein